MSKSESEDLFAINEVRQIMQMMRLDEAIGLAREARQHGVSHVGFQVGAAALARRGNEENFLIGFNYKPKKNERGSKDRGERICAEVAILRQAQAEGWETIHYFVTYAPRKRDDWSGKEHEALPPCGPCRCYFTRLFAHGTRLISPYTPIMAVNADTGGDRVYMLGQLLVDEFSNDRHRLTARRSQIVQACVHGHPSRTHAH